jgi:hypothetical protein
MTISISGVDRSGTIVLKYKNGGMAVLCFNNDNAFGNNTLTVLGSKGNVKVCQRFSWN